MSAYLPIFCMMVLAVLFAGLSFIASSMLGPKRPTQAKDAPYECGIVPTIEPAHRFPVRFYLVAMIFIIFDIEIIFIYPWAVVYRGFSPGSFGLIEMVVFAIAVFVSFVALYKSHFLSIPASIVLGFVIALAGAIGDLFESALKRDMHVKDTGSLLAGHGGVLDRLDSVLFAAIASFYAILALQ